MKIELSEKQKEIIKFMREQYTYKLSFPYPLNRGKTVSEQATLLHPGKSPVKVTIEDDKYLYDKGIIGECDCKFEVQLTDVGKTIEL